MARLYNNIGSNYQYRGQHNEAGAYYLKAAGEATKDSTLKGLLAYIYANIGGTLIQIREHEKAVYYFDMAERIARFLKDDRILAHVLGNIGIYYEEKNDFIKSQRYYLESLALSEQHDLHSTHLTALTNLGAMIQELVHNILKHAHATHAIILLNRQNDRIHLTVEDNGVGMDPARAGSKGLGLKGLHAKVNALNGYVSLESSPGNGTTIYIELAARTNKKETIDMARLSGGTG
jgi:tetratricopeptide (TPR) repeat protein